MAVVPFTLVSANALGSGTFTMPTPSGVIRTGVTAGDTLKLQAYDTDTGPAYTDLLTLTAGTTPSMTGVFANTPYYDIATKPLAIRGASASPDVGISLFNNTFSWIYGGEGALSIGYITGNDVTLRSMYTLGWSATTSVSPQDTFLSREGAAILQLGADAAGTTAYTIKGNDRITSDGVGGDLTIAAGRGLGAAGGSLYFQTAAAGATGVAGTLTTALTIGPAGTLSSSTYILAGTNLIATSGIYPTTGSSTGILAPSDGLLTIQKNNGTGFTTLNLGPATGNTANGTTVISKATATLSALSGATVTSSNLIPAGSLVLGVTVLVSTLITGATSFSIGDGTDADRWGATIAVAAGTKTTGANFTITTPPHYAAATSVVLTAAGSNFTAGEVKITVHYISFIAQSA